MKKMQARRAPRLAAPFPALGAGSRPTGRAPAGGMRALVVRALHAGVVGAAAEREPAVAMPAAAPARAMLAGA